MELFENFPNSIKQWNVTWKFFCNMYYRSSYHGKHTIRIVCTCIFHFVLSLHARACVYAYPSYAYACVVVFALDHMSTHVQIMCLRA